MSSAPEEIRVLAIDPTTRGFAFVVMEGPERLVDWGVKTVRPAGHAECLAMIAAEIKFSRPSAIVLEDACRPGSRRCRRVRRLIRAISGVAAKAKVRTRLVCRREIRRTFSPTCASTKHQIAVAIASALPELADRLPPYRRCGMTEDYRMNIFDAAALAFAFFDSMEKRRQA